MRSRPPKPLPPVEHLRIDPERVCDHDRCSGIFVRAFDRNGHVGTYAIEELDKRSLAQWLRTRGSREYVEDVIGILLGHGFLHTPDDGMPS